MKYITGKEIMNELDNMFEREIKRCQKNAYFIGVPMIKSLKKITAERLEAAEIAYDEIINLMNRANEEGREREAETYRECSILLAKRIGLECFRIENGEERKMW